MSEMSMSSALQSEEDQKPGWFELFYDLVIVAAIGHGTSVFSEKPSWSTAILIAITLAFLFGVWLMTVMSYGLFPGDDPIRQGLVLVQMLAIVVSSLHLGMRSTQTDDVMFGALALAMLSIALMYLRTTIQSKRAGDETDNGASAAMLGAFASALVYAIGAIMSIGGDQSQNTLRSIAIVAIVLSLLPMLSIGIRRLVAGGVPNARHLEERLGLLVIIVLGESFAHLINDLASVGSIPNPTFFALTFFATFAVWSIYFSSISQYGVPVRAGGLRIWLLMHYVLTFGAVAMAAGLSSLAMIPGDDPNPGPHGTWTVLPFLYIIGSITVMTLLEFRRWTAQLTVHAITLAILTVMLVLQMNADPVNWRWWVMAACITVLVEAIVLAALRVRGRRALR